MGDIVEKNEVDLPPSHAKELAFPVLLLFFSTRSGLSSLMLLSCSFLSRTSVWGNPSLGLRGLCLVPPCPRETT